MTRRFRLAPRHAPPPRPSTVRRTPGRRGPVPRAPPALAARPAAAHPRPEHEPGAQERGVAVLSERRRLRRCKQPAAGPARSLSAPRSAAWLFTERTTVEWDSTDLGTATLLRCPFCG